MVTVLCRRPFMRTSSSICNSTCAILRQGRRGLKSSSDRVPKFGFAFDIDGVLLRSSKPLPGSKNALLTLKRHRIPFVLLTNGGGKLESERAKELSDRLEVDIDESLLIQSHTPYAGLATEGNLRDKHILVLGGEGEKCRKVAESYGFKNVVIPSDIFHAHPELWPFSAPFANYHAAAAKPLPLALFTPSGSQSVPVEGEHLKIDAIFVYNDPRDMGLDTQLVIDLLLSDQGFLGTISENNGTRGLPNGGYLSSAQPPLYFANPDLFWAAQHHLPRLGSGAFKASLEGLWDEITGKEGIKMNITMGGKPNRSAYEFANAKLEDNWQQMHGSQSIGNKLERVYMVGDNTASDITGANSFKSPDKRVWSSYLVRSGVWNGKKPATDIETPDEIVDGVNDAVESVLRREKWITDNTDQKRY